VFGFSPVIVVFVTSASPGTTAGPRLPPRQVGDAMTD